MPALGIRTTQDGLVVPTGVPVTTIPLPLPSTVSFTSTPAVTIDDGPGLSDGMDGFTWTPTERPVAPLSRSQVVDRVSGGPPATKK
jgi:hypothetical protein